MRRNNTEKIVTKKLFNNIMTTMKILSGWRELEMEGYRIGSYKITIVYNEKDEQRPPQVLNIIAKRFNIIISPEKNRMRSSK